MSICFKLLLSMALLTMDLAYGFMGDSSSPSADGARYSIFEIVMIVLVSLGVLLLLYMLNNRYGWFNIPIPAIVPSPIPSNALDAQVREALEQTAFTFTEETPVPDGLKECPICKEEYDPDCGLISVKGCDHTFHANCLITYMLHGKNCPTCRNPVTV